MRKKDKKVVKVVKEIKKVGVGNLRGNEWKIKEDLVLKKGYTEGWRVKSRDNLVILWYTSSKTWRKIENNRVGDKKLLVARDYKGYWKIYRQMWFISKNKE